MLKQKIKSFLQTKGLYYPLKYSRVFRIYQSLFKPGVIKQERSEISFYRSFLSSCKLIFDIGANDGHKTAAFLKIADKVVACEPDKENFLLLQARFRSKRQRVAIENKALSDKEGVTILYSHHRGSAFNTLSDKWKKILEADNITRWNEKISFTGKQETETTTLDNLIKKYGTPDFIKIDVEGYEEFVLKGLSHPVKFISFETLLPEYASELGNCIAAIESLGSRVNYNIALHEKLVLSSFVNKTELERWCKANSNTGSFEVIAKLDI